jgi:hypothetical protein
VKFTNALNSTRTTGIWALLNVLAVFWVGRYQDLSLRHYVDILSLAFVFVFFAITDFLLFGQLLVIRIAHQRDESKLEVAVTELLRKFSLFGYAVFAVSGAIAPSVFDYPSATKVFVCFNAMVAVLAAFGFHYLNRKLRALTQDILSGQRDARNSLGP